MHLAESLSVYGGSQRSSLATGCPHMTKRPEVVADNEEPGPEPEGFWAGIHAETARLTKLGRDDNDAADGS